MPATQKTRAGVKVGWFFIGFGTAVLLGVATAVAVAVLLLSTVLHTSVGSLVGGTPDLGSPLGLLP